MVRYRRLHVIWRFVERSNFQQIQPIQLQKLPVEKAIITVLISALVWWCPSVFKQQFQCRNWKTIPLLWEKWSKKETCFSSAVTKTLLLQFLQHWNEIKNFLTPLYSPALFTACWIGINMSRKLWWDVSVGQGHLQTDLSWPHWPKGCPIPYDIVFSNKRRRKKEEGGMFRVTVFLLPSHR